MNYIYQVKTVHKLCIDEHRETRTTVHMLKYLACFLSIMIEFYVFKIKAPTLKCSTETLYMIHEKYNHGLR